MAGNITIVRGSSAVLVVDLTDKKTGEPFSLVGVTAASGIMANEDGTTYMVKTLAASGITIEDEESGLGRLRVHVEEEDSELLEVAEDGADMELRIVRDGDTGIAQFEEKINVKETLFPDA